MCGVLVFVKHVIVAYNTVGRTNPSILAKLGSNISIIAGFVRVVNGCFVARVTC